MKHDKEPICNEVLEGALQHKLCKCNEIFPNKPKFAGRGEDPCCFCKMDPMVFSDLEMMKDWNFGEFFESHGLDMGH